MAQPSKPWYRSQKDAWYARIGGKLVSLGVTGRRSKAEAVRAWHKLMLAERKPEPDAKPATVADVLTAFLADVASRAKAKTVKVYRWFLEPFKAKHGRLPASALTPTVCEAWSRRPGWSSSTRYGLLGSLVTAMRWAVRARMLASNPLAGVQKPPKASRGAKALVSHAEHRRLMASASRHFRPYLSVLWATGARPSEVAGITAANFDAKAGVVRLAEHKLAHKGHARTIYLPPDAVALLRRLANRYPAGPLLRTSCGNGWSEDAVVRAMLAARQRADVPHATAYGYRHSFGTDALCRGVPDAAVAELMGHSGTGMLHKHYAHLSARGGVLRAALERVR
jgi:integrase